MRRRLALLLLPVLAVAAAAWWCGGQAPAAPEAGGAPPAATSKVKPVGVGSCAAMACHHGNGPHGSEGSEYSTWIAVDPHAKAYRTLFSPESRQMHAVMAQFHPEMARAAGAHENRLCLRCHGMGDDVPKSLHPDGAGCEQCHGPAGKWKSTHYLPGFDRRTEGFLDLRDDLVVRATTCMKCHVGDASREVNHDLIAAGHPRLRFEYGAYYANYPRHWCDRDKSPNCGKPALYGADMEVRSWVLGQLASARAALDLLATRAADPSRPWPEFAEYDCAACHHGLQASSFRQKRDLERAEKGVRFRPGELPWGTWYYPLLPALPQGKALGKDLAALDALMRRPLPDRAAVKQKAGEAARSLDAELKRWRSLKYETADIRGLIQQVAGQTAPVRQGWDGGTQVYLGLAALHNGWADLDGAFRAASAQTKPLLGLRRTLQNSFPKGARPLYDSPSNYDPAEALKGVSAAARALLPHD